MIGSYWSLKIFFPPIPFFLQKLLFCLFCSMMLPFSFRIGRLAFCKNIEVAWRERKGKCRLYVQELVKLSIVFFFFFFGPFFLSSVHNGLAGDDVTFAGVVGQPRLHGRAHPPDVLLVGVEAVLELQGVQENVGLVVALHGRENIRLNK